ncbi:MAG: hypothetical protein H6Q15_2281 [Bacteroidetes bacterium]|nr:hypothetical protein [Bacteroidota bacterium]
MVLLKTVSLNEPLNVIVQNKPEAISECLSNPNTIIAICAILISLFGIVISLIYYRKTLNATIKHNKLSVEPLLFIDVSIIDNDIKVELINGGLGTAKLNTLKICYNDKMFADFNKLMKDCSISETERHIYKLFDKNSPIPSNKREDVFIINCTSLEMTKAIEAIFKEVSVIIEYESMYGEKKYFSDALIPKNL